MVNLLTIYMPGVVICEVQQEWGSDGPMPTYLESMLIPAFYKVNKPRQVFWLFPVCHRLPGEKNAALQWPDIGHA